MTQIILFKILLLIELSIACPRSSPSPPPVVRCQALSDPLNGRISYSSCGREVGTTLTYNCDPGYYVQGPSTRSCQSDAQWSGEDSVCLSITCNNLAARPNCDVTYEDSNGAVTDYGKRATFSPRAGYVLVGTSPLICQGASQPGMWSASLPMCLRQCPAVSSPSNGQISYSSSNRAEGSTLQVTCNAGYYVQGAPQRTCQSDGTWSGAAATCQEIFCNSFSSFQNGAVSYSSTSGFQIPFGATATFSCNSPYTLRGSDTLTCQGTTSPGTWSDFTPFCSMGTACNDPGTLQNGQIMGHNMYYDGVTLSFTCNANYELNGASSIMCTSNGQWTDSLPSCIERRYDCSTSEPCNPPIIAGKSLYRHTDDNRYIQCNNGLCYVQSCPNGLVFDSPRGYCDYPPTG